MNPLPHGAWLDSAAARAIGPVEIVCAPVWGNFKELGVAVMFVGLAVLLTQCLVVCDLGGRAAGLAVFMPCLPLAYVLALMGLALMRYDELRDRLLLGQRGIALWSPGPAIVILWAELGETWHRMPLRRDDGQPLSVVLERRGTQLAITAAFAEYHKVVLRVLEELALRTRISAGEKPSPSDAITPAERSVVEPGETP
jgi:hypothetical protein